MSRRTHRSGANLLGSLEILEDRRVLALVASLVDDWSPGGVGSYPRLLTEWNDDLYFDYRGDGERLSALVDGRVQVVFESRRLELESFYFPTEKYLYVARGGDDVDGPHEISLTRFDGQLFESVNVCGDAGCVPVRGPSDLTYYQGDLYLLSVTEEEWEYEELIRIRDDEAQVVARIPSMDGVRRSGQDRMTVYGDRLMIGTTDLWSFDGSILRPEYELASATLPRELTVYGDKLFFVEGRPDLPSYLVSYDGAKFQRIAKSGEFADAPRELTVYRDSLVFSAGDRSTGRELWRYSDLLGLTQLADLDAGDGDSNPAELLVFQDSLYFTADRSSSQRELFRYDERSVAAVNDLDGVVALHDTQGLAVYRDQLVMSADDGRYGQEIWAFDGTQTELLADVRLGFESTYFADAAEWKGELFLPLIARTAFEPPPLLRYDGSELSVVSSGILDVPLPPSEVIGRTDDGLVLSIRTQYPFGGYALALFDGETVTALSEAPLDIAGARSAVEFEGQLYLGSSELFSYDFESQQYLSRADLLPEGSSNPRKLNVVDDRLYMLARHDLSTDRALWSYQQGQSQRLSGDVDVEDYLVYNGELHYVARVADRTDPAYVVYRIRDGVSQSVAEIPMRFTDWHVHDDTLYLAGAAYDTNEMSIQQSIWSFDGSQQQLVFDRTLSGVAGARTGATELTTWQNDLFFLLDSGTAMELWRYDGRAFFPALADTPGTSIPQGGVDPWLPRLWAWGDQLLMTGDDGTTGEELWRITPARPGDLNGDGRFDSSDLVRAFQAGKYETDEAAVWSEGDWNGDGRFTTADLILAFDQGYDDAPSGRAAIRARLADLALAIDDERASS